MLSSLVYSVETSRDGWDDRGHYTDDSDMDSPAGAVDVCIRVAEKAIESMKVAGGVNPGEIRQWIKDIAKGEYEITPDVDEVNEVVELLYECILNKNLTPFNEAVYEFMWSYPDWCYTFDTDVYHEVEGLEEWSAE